MAKMRWGADAPNDTLGARERLIDAAETSFRRYGVLKTTVEDVATAASVSRATVYRYFADRDELILGVLLRDASRFLDKLSDEIARHAEFEEAVVRGVLFTVKAVRSDENLALLFAPEVVGITTSIAGASDALFQLTAIFLTPFFDAARQTGQMRGDVTVEDASEWLLRAVISLLTVRGSVKRTAANQRQFLSDFLVTALTVESNSSSIQLAPVRRPNSRTRSRSPQRK